MAEQHQRGYDDPYRGGRRGRSDRGDGGRWMAEDDSRMQPHDVRDDDRLEGNGRRFEGNRWSGREARYENEPGWRGGETPGRSTEWTTAGRGVYGSESGEFERSRWRGGYDPYASSGSGRHVTEAGESWRGAGHDERARPAGSYGNYRSGYGEWGRVEGSREYRGNPGGWQGGVRSDWHDAPYEAGPRRTERESWGGAIGDYGRSMRPTQRFSSGRTGTSFAGRGPKDYHRSDDRIREEISDYMTDDHDLDASDISVQVRSGEVTLTGTVRTREQKRRAEDLAEGISGVNDVVNNIRVKHEDNGGRQFDQASAPSGTSDSIGQAGAQTSKTGRSTGPDAS